ncbi:MAG: serine acetyltransferase [Thermodesulfobacteriota bacterium]
MYLNAISFYRLARFFHERKVPVLPRIFEFLIFLIFNCSIPVDCEIGAGTICEHRGIGVVISYQARIGQNCLIKPRVLIGEGGPVPGAPVIGDRVDIGVGASIIGGITVGDEARIGTNAVVLTDVPPRATAVGVPARIIIKNNRSDTPAPASE